MNKIKNFFVENMAMLIMLGLAAAFLTVLRVGFGMNVLPIEIGTIFFGIVFMDLARRQKAYSFFFNLAFGALLIVWAWQLGLYGQIAMRLFVAAIAIAGIYFWIRPDKNKKLLQPTNLSIALRFALYGGAAAAAVILLFAFGAIKTMDWSVAGLVIIGTMLLSRKKVDAWICFLLADVTSLFLYSSAGAYAYLAYLGCAIFIEINSIRDWGMESKE